jgi:hypothetical protein
MQAVLQLRKIEKVSGHFFKISSTVNRAYKICVSIAPKIHLCEKSLFALAQITENKKARGPACF